MFLDYLLEHGVTGGGDDDISKDVRSATMDLVDVYQGYASASLYGSFVAYIGIDPSSAKQRREKPTQSSILLVTMPIRSVQ